MLATALSQLLIAFTIEFDDAFEARMPHRTARGPSAGSSSGPWLVSRAMWANFLRWIPEDGLLDYASLAAITNQGGLLRWGYLEVDGDRARLTTDGAAANRIWASLTEEIEERWRARFGAERVEQLRRALTVGSDTALPWALPVVGVVSTSRRLDGWSSTQHGADDELPTLLARALMTIARASEFRSAVPLHLGANALRVADGARARDLPSLAGISREAASLSIAALERQGLLMSGSTLELTEDGRRARDAHQAIEAEIDRRTDPAIAAAAEAVLADTESLAEGLRSPSEGWRSHPPYRAQTARLLDDPRGTLAHFPMVLHRGGYPDGS